MAPIPAKISKRGLIRSRLGAPFKVAKAIRKTPVPVHTKYIRASVKKQRKNHAISFARYLHHMLKNTNGSVSVKAMDVLDNMCLDIFKKIANEASILLKHSNKLTLQQSDIQAALRLLFPGNIQNSLISRGSNAVMTYKNSLNGNKMTRSNQIMESGYECVCPM